MRQRNVVALAIALFLPGAAPARAADRPPELREPAPGFIQLVEMRDGTRYLGRIAGVADGAVRFETSYGALQLPADRIAKVEELLETSLRPDGSYWFPNPNATRLFFAPTARPLRQGEGYFADYYVLLPMLAYGLTDRISVAGGMSLVPFAGFDRQVYYLAPKVGLFQAPGLDVGAGVLAAYLPFVGAPGPTSFAGIGYGVVTVGDADSALTAGLGYGYLGGNTTKYPIGVLGGEKRLLPYLSLVSENWIVPVSVGRCDYGPPDADGKQPAPVCTESTGLIAPVSAGVRLFGESLSVDLGFAYPIMVGSPGGSPPIGFPIPYVDFVYNWR